MLTTFTPSPIFTVESPFSLDIDADSDTFYPKNGTINSTFIYISNEGDYEGWDNLSISVENPRNYTIELIVNSVNVSNVGDLTQSSSNFSKYVWVKDSLNNLTLNLTSGSYANLSLSILPTGEVVAGEETINIEVISRTEKVYTRTFYIEVEEEY